MKTRLNKRSSRRSLLTVLLVVALALSCMTVFAAADEEDVAAAPLAIVAATAEEPAEEAIDLTDYDTAQEYVDNYADNLMEDENFEANVDAALATVRTEHKSFATAWALLPPQMLQP